MWANSKIPYCVQILGQRNCDVYQIFYVPTLFPTAYPKPPTNMRPASTQLEPALSRQKSASYPTSLAGSIN